MEAALKEASFLDSVKTVLAVVRIVTS